MPSAETVLAQKYSAAEKDVEKYHEGLRMLGGKINTMQKVKQSLLHIATKSTQGGDKISADIESLASKLEVAQETFKKKEDLWSALLQRKNDQITLLLKKDQMWSAKLKEKCADLSVSLRQLADERKCAQQLIRLKNDEIGEYQRHYGKLKIISRTEEAAELLASLEEQLNSERPVEASVARMFPQTTELSNVAMHDTIEVNIKSTSPHSSKSPRTIPKAPLVASETVTSMFPVAPEKEGKRYFTSPRVSRLMKSDRILKEKSRDILQFFPGYANIAKGGNEGNEAISISNGISGSETTVPIRLQVGTLLETYGLETVMGFVHSYDGFSDADAATVKQLKLASQSNLSSNPSSNSPPSTSTSTDQPPAAPISPEAGSISEGPPNAGHSSPLTPGNLPHSPSTEKGAEGEEGEGTSPHSEGEEKAVVSGLLLELERSLSVHGVAMVMDDVVKAASAAGLVDSTERRQMVSFAAFIEERDHLVACAETLRTIEKQMSDTFSLCLSMRVNDMAKGKGERIAARDAGDAVIAGFARTVHSGLSKLLLSVICDNCVSQALSMKSVNSRKYGHEFDFAPLSKYPLLVDSKGHSLAGTKEDCTLPRVDREAGGGAAPRRQLKMHLKTPRI